MKLSNALRQVISSIKDYVDRVMPKKLSDLEIDMELGAVKTVNGNEPDENGNVEVKSVADFYELENKPFECELNLLETIHVDNINGTVQGYPRTNLTDYSHICVEIDDKYFFDIIQDRESGRWGDVDKSLWDNGDGYGFYIEFENRGVGRFIIYTDTNRYGNSSDVKLYEQITKKELNPQYLPKAGEYHYGAVKVSNGDDWAEDYEKYAPCVTFDGQVYSKSYKAANVFSELSFENLEILIDYEGNHGLFTDSVVEDISNEIELTLPVHAWYIGYDYTNYSRKYLFETANGETLLLNIKNSTITKTQRLYEPQNSSSVFTVNIEETGWDEENERPILSADKRFSDIYEAYQNGIIVQASNYGVIYHMTNIEEDYVCFEARASDGIICLYIELTDDENIDNLWEELIFTELICEFSRDSETGEYYPIDCSMFLDCPLGSVVFLYFGVDYESQEISRSFKFTETSLEVYFKNKTLIVSAEDGSVTEKREISDFISTNYINDLLNPDVYDSKMVLVTSCHTNNQTGIYPTDPLLVTMAKPMSYTLPFSAVDGDGVRYRGGIDRRNNIIEIQVDESIATIINLPSRVHPYIEPEIFLSLSNGFYNYMEGISVDVNVGVDDNGQPIIRNEYICGIFNKFNDNCVVCYGTGLVFEGLSVNSESGTLCAEFMTSIDGSSRLEIERIGEELGNILGINNNELSTEDKTIVGAINELNAKHTEGTDSLVLLSPNGTRFSLTVGDDGVLSATEITE